MPTNEQIRKLKCLRVSKTNYQKLKGKVNLIHSENNSFTFGLPVESDFICDNNLDYLLLGGIQ